MSKIIFVIRYVHQGRSCRDFASLVLYWSLCSAVYISLRANVSFVDSNVNHTLIT